MWLVCVLMAFFDRQLIPCIADFDTEMPSVENTPFDPSGSSKSTRDDISSQISLYS